MRATLSFRRCWLSFTVLALACLCVGQPLAAQTAAAGNTLTFKVQAAAERLEMTVNTSRIVELPFKVPRLYVGSPELVKASPLSPNQIQLTALKPGITQVNVWDEEDRVTTIDVIIYGDARELEMLLRSEFPDAQLRIRPLSSSVYLSGFVPRAEQVGQIVRMAEDFYPKVINNITVGGVQQILLNVKVMEVSRTKLRNMGVDWSNINGNFFLTQRSGDIISSIDQDSGLPVVLAQGAGKDTIRFGVVNGVDQFYGFLELLRQNQLAKLLAEPKLITVSGRPASFNVGGQIPIPVAQSLGTVTVVYRDFGTQIDFVPIVLGNGSIRLEVRPDITEVDPSLRDSTTGVPGFRRRYADTAVELKAGQTMAVAGLIYQRTDSTNRGVPWLADLPWVGAAFRRTSETANEVELVITVTPEFVDAMDPHEVPPCGPGTTTKNPSDTELYWRGYIETPRCCDDGSCSQCQERGQLQEHGGAQHAAPTAASFPQGAPAPVVVSQASAQERAPQTAPQFGGGFTQPSGFAPAPQTGSYYGRPDYSGRAAAAAPRMAEPGLIGPQGYDRLR
jgi:pilus assembly protein CpaC